VDIEKPVKSKRAIGEPHPALIVKAYCLRQRLCPLIRVEVITAVGGCRRYCSVAEKVRFVEDTLQLGMSVYYVAERAGVAPSLRRGLFAVGICLTRS
jgi:hypothetical protein